MTRFESSVRTSRPIAEVFAYVSDPLNLPRWNSASAPYGQEGEVGSTYMIERELPSGPVHNELVIVAHVPRGEFGIRTTSGPTPFTYRYRFSTANGETVLHLDAAVELTGAAALLCPLAGRAIKRGVDDNFGELKRLLEPTAKLW
jgi:uncharacterized protein YndB with AHSA1/START domain